MGGGPAGSTLGWALASAGAQVAILDRARFPREKACAEYLSPQSSRILQAMGVLQQVEHAGGAELRGMCVVAPSGERIVGEFNDSHGYAPFRDRGIALRRLRLDPILLERARGAGADVLEETQVLDVVRDPAGTVTGVRARRDGRELSLPARFVIGADGLRSVVARRLGLARSSPWPRRMALVSHYERVSDVGPLGEMHVDRDGYLGLADVGGGVTNVALVVPSSELRRRAPSERRQLVQTWIAERPLLAERFARARALGEPLITGPFATRCVRAWAPGAALVGDAAEFFDPFTGEGIYAALRGGELLAPFLLDALRSGRAQHAGILQAYENARRQEFRGKWTVEWLIGCAVASPLLMNRAARALARRRDLADLLVGVTGDFVPAREVLRPSYLVSMLLPAGLMMPRARRPWNGTGTASGRS